MCAIFLTFSESKQAITLPFSTWQLFVGWANLHSSSLREQFPRWNCRQTSRVSHFVSLTEEMFNAMSKGYNHICDFSFFKLILLSRASYTKSCELTLCIKSSFKTTWRFLHELEQKDQMAGQSLRNHTSKKKQPQMEFFFLWNIHMNIPQMREKAREF